MTTQITAAEYRKGGSKPKRAYQALGRLRIGDMNKLEAKYALHLEGLKMAGEILYYKFDAINLRLADGCFYKPDFMVLTKDNALQMHETKGFMTDDALVKLKVAAATFPFPFFLVKWIKGAWVVQEF